MKSRLQMFLASMVLVLSGCAVTQQKPIALAPETLSQGSGRIGVAMTVLPKVDTSFPGAGCLLCLAFASASNSALTTHTQTLPYEDLPDLKKRMQEVLSKKGGDVIVINDPIDLKALPDATAKGPNATKKDFASFRQKYKLDRLVVIEIDQLGMSRDYSAYIPTSDPKAVLHGVGYIVNLDNNTYEWYEPVDITRSAESNWDEPPKFPGLTNAYFQVLELGKDDFLKPFATALQSMVTGVASDTANH